MKKHFFLSVLALSFFYSLTTAQLESRVLNFNPALKPFYHGVASGDPLNDRVIIWTRLTPDTGFVGPAVVDWRVALDTGMTQIVQSGTYTTHDTLDYTIKVDVTGLQENTYYYYEFTHNQQHSIRGRTKTAPTGMQDSLRFAVVSCAYYENGYFNAYRILTERNDVDGIIHLGDYIYEYENEYSNLHDPGLTNRRWEPAGEILNLSDYRMRYSSYHLDEDLMRLHQQFPMMVVWDDHESANNSWRDGAENHDTGEGQWPDRKSDAQQAFMEWLPVRHQQPGNNDVIYRRVRYGDLLELFMLDTRLRRDEQAGTTGSVVNDPNRTMLGTDQYNWLLSGMLSSTSQWKVMGQQVMFAPLEVAGIPVNEDQWDGYPVERNKIMSFILANGINDIAVLTGDIHTSWANDVPTANYQSNGNGSAFVEFVTPSVTTTNSPVTVPVQVIQLANNHIKYVDLAEHGFIILDVNQQRIQSDWFYVNTISQSSNQYYYGDSWYENHNERHLRHSNSAAIVRHNMYHLQAPPLPRPFVQPPTTGVETNEDVLIVGAYPNPFTESITLQLVLNEPSDITLEILDLNGNRLSQTSHPNQEKGGTFFTLDMSAHASGTYLVRVTGNDFTRTFRVIKQ